MRVGQSERLLLTTGARTIRCSSPSGAPSLSPIICVAMPGFLRAKARRCATRGRVEHSPRYVSAEPLSCWALNLALLHAVRRSVASCSVRQVSWHFFRRNLDPIVITAQLINDASMACAKVYDRRKRLECDSSLPQRACGPLATGVSVKLDCWSPPTASARAQFGRSLELSRAGTNIDDLQVFVGGT